jgi:anion-transporting  ArsA/GET3 family ATPase
MRGFSSHAMTLPRVVLVTGKGGTGKSTVAAALATALSCKGATVLADLDGRMEAAALVGARIPLEAPQRVTGSLEVIALSRREELNSFIRRIVPVSAISERMLRSRTFGYVTAALPGLEAFLLLERLRIMAGEAALEDRRVVIDAPASGTAVELLAVASGVKGIAPAGTLNRLAAEVEEFLADPNRFGVVVTVTPEKMALHEAIETAQLLRDRMSVAVVGAVLNRACGALFSDEDLQTLAALKSHRGLARKRMTQGAATEIARIRLGNAGIPIVEMPMLYKAAMGPDEISTLARAFGPMIAQ